MRTRAVALSALIAIIAITALPAHAKDPSAARDSRYALTGEARGLELALGEGGLLGDLSKGLTLGFALAKVDSAPSALGIGAARCDLLGADVVPSALPCSSDTTAKSAYPGDEGSDAAKCLDLLPDALAAVITLHTACGSSKSSLVNGIPQTLNKGQVAGLKIALPVVPVLAGLPNQNELVTNLATSLTDLLPAKVELPVVKDAVSNLLEIVDGVANSDALAIDLGSSFSNVTNDGKMINVDSSAAGARIGILGIPNVDAAGLAIDATADPLTNGLVIIEVGTADANVAVDKLTGKGTSSASPALVTVKIRDITKPLGAPSYISQSVAPGQTLTVLEGTPAESTIIAADSTTSNTTGRVAAAADAVRLNLLKGINGGVQLGLARATAAAKAAPIKPAPPIAPAASDKELPATGARDFTVLGLVFVFGAIGAFLLRRRFATNS